MSASTTNRPGPLQSWLLDQFESVRAPEPDEVNAVTRAARDTFAVAVAGGDQESVRWATTVATDSGVRGPAHVWGTALRLDPASAALVNGTRTQALEFDDIAPALAAHLSSVVFPTVTAFEDEIDPAKAIEGVACALRIAAAMRSLIGFDAHSRGLQPTHTIGPLIASFATAHALGLSREEASTAMSLAVSGSLGLRANTGTRSKALQSGLAAAAAVRAVQLARVEPGAGASAVDSVFALLGADAATVDEVVSSPLPEPAFLAVKPYPTSGAAHSSVETVLAVRSAVPDGTVPDRLVVRVPPRVLTAMAFDPAVSADEARWSIRWVLATAWETGSVDPTEFTDENVQRTSEQRSPAWLEVVGDDTFEPRGEQSIAELTAGSRRERAEVEHRSGYPERPLTDDSVRAKFDRCLEIAGLSDSGNEIWQALGEAPVRFPRHEAASAQNR